MLSIVIDLLGKKIYGADVTHEARSQGLTYSFPEEEGPWKEVSASLDIPFVGLTLDRWYRHKGLGHFLTYL